MHQIQKNCLLALAASAGLTACQGGDATGVCSASELPTQPGDASCTHRSSHDIVDEVFRGPVLDILFVIDNTPSMVAKQRELAKALPQFIQQLEAREAHYHIGIVTTDVGSLPQGGAAFPVDAKDACASERGDDGLLQILPCGTRPGLTPGARAACLNEVSALCATSRFAPMDGQRFIALDEPTGSGNIQPYIIDGRDVAPQIALQCMALLGGSGCALTSPLEAAKRALDGHLAGNRGFLRPDSTLSIVFVTDKDDCSVQSARRVENDPQTVASFVSAGQTYPCDTGSGVEIPSSCYNREYRCLARGMECDEAMNSAGPKHNCREKSGSYLQPLDSYVRFIAALRTKEKIRLLGLWPDGAYTNASGEVGKPGRVQIVGDSMGTPDPAQLHAATGPDAACDNPGVPGSEGQSYSGGAQVRLSRFLQRFDPAIYREASICAAPTYSEQLAYAKPAYFVSSGYVPDCLSVRPHRAGLSQAGDGVQGQAACQVGFVSDETPAGSPDTLLPQCGNICCRAWSEITEPSRLNPAIRAACASESQDCFCAVESAAGRCQGTAVAGIWRSGGKPMPVGTVASFRCAGTAPQ
jgi:hypothetical protein